MNIARNATKICCGYDDRDYVDDDISGGDEICAVDFRHIR